MKRLASFILAILITGGAAHAASHYYILPYAANNSSLCADRAGVLAARFEQITGTVVSRSACEQSQPGWYDLRVTYAAEEAVNVVTTGATKSPGLNPGNFQTEGDCRAALAMEQERFERLTGLRTFVSYCHPQDEFESDTWVLRVEGFGVARLKPYYSGGLIFGSPQQVSRETIEKRIAAALTTRGFETSFAKLRDDAGILNFTALYYAAEPLYLSVQEFATVPSLERCATYASQMPGLLGGEAALISFCTQSMFGTFTTQAILVNQPHIMVGSTPERFVSFDACESDREDLITAARGRGLTVLGGLCSLPDAPYSWQWSVALVQVLTPK